MKKTHTTFYTKVSTFSNDIISEENANAYSSIKSYPNFTMTKQASVSTRISQKSKMPLHFISFILMMLLIGFSTTLQGQCGSAFAIQASCTNNTVDPLTAYLQISGIPTDADRYSWSQGSTYDPGAVIGDNSLTPISGAGLPVQFIGQGVIPNPTSSQDYTIRFYNNIGSGDIFLCDVIVTMNEQDCTIGCDCVDQLYLNEPGIGTVYKFSVDPSNGDLTAIGNPWYGGSELPSPHGLGVDLNGLLYIGEYPGPGSNIRKLTCDGEIFDEADFVYANDGSFNIGSYDGILYTNDISFDNNGGITAYDPCEDEELGTLTFCESGTGDFDYDWGLWIDPNTGTGYAANILFLPGDVREYYLHIFEVSDLDLGGGTSCSTATLQITDFPFAAPWTVYGITTDLNGNIYMVLTDDISAATVISKYDASLNHIGFSAVDNNFTDGGYALSAGIVYSAAANRLYVASQSEFESCLTSFSTDLTIIEEEVGPSAVAGAFFKGIAIVTECCPTNNNQTINRVLCSSSSIEDIFLNIEFPCEGTICEGQWVPADAASMAVFDACKQVVIVGTVAGCYSFTKSSDGTGVNSRCGAFTQTFNLQILEADDISISSDNTCGPATLTATTTAGSIQWQSSTTSATADDFIDIGGETGMTLATGVVSVTTYYRAVVRETSAGSGTCPGGSCDLPSNVVTVLAAPTVTLTDPADQCIDGTDMAFTATPAPAAGTTGVFSTTAGAGLTNNNDGTATLDISAAGAGTYDVTYTHTDANGCEAEQTVSIEIFALPEVTVASPATICSTQAINLTQGTSISPTGIGGTWSSSGNGTFTAGTDFATATTYTPGSDDITAGYVTLTLITNDPTGLCGGTSASVTFQILKVDCGAFPWDGSE